MTDYWTNYRTDYQPDYRTDYHLGSSRIIRNCLLLSGIIPNCPKSSIIDSCPSPTDSLISLSYLMVAFSANSFIHFCGDTYYSNTPDSNTVLPNLSPWLEWSIPYGPCFYAMSLMNFWSIGRTFLLTSEDGGNKILVITIIELEARPRIGTDVLMLLVGTVQGQIVKNGHCSNYFGRTELNNH